MAHRSIDMRREGDATWPCRRCAEEIRMLEDEIAEQSDELDSVEFALAYREVALVERRCLMTHQTPDWEALREALVAYPEMHGFPRYEYAECATVEQAARWALDLSALADDGARLVVEYPTLINGLPTFTRTIGIHRQIILGGPDE